MFNKLYVSLIAVLTLFSLSLTTPAQAQYDFDGLYVYDIAAGCLNYGFTNNGFGSYLNYDYTANVEYSGFVTKTVPLISVGSFAGHVESAGFFYTDLSSSTGIASFGTFDVGADGTNSIKVVDMFTGQVYMESSGLPLWGAAYIW